MEMEVLTRCRGASTERCSGSMQPRRQALCFEEEPEKTRRSRRKSQALPSFFYFTDL